VTSSEHELRDAAEALLDAVAEFNCAASDVLANSAWRLKREPWRRRSDGLRRRAAELVKLVVRIQRETDSLESYIFATDIERDRLDYGEAEVLQAMPRPRSDPEDQSG
jgi:hypothetical protein